MKLNRLDNVLFAPLVVAIAAMPAIADSLHSSGAQGQLGRTSDYTRLGVDANRQVYDYQGNTSTNAPRSLGGLPPCTTAILGGVFGTPDYSTDWGPLPADAAPIVNQVPTPYEYKTSTTNSYYDQVPTNNTELSFNDPSGAVGTAISRSQTSTDAYTNFVKNWKGPGPPPVPIFQCAYGWGWMPQAGAGAASNPGGGYHGQDGGIIRTGSWNPSSLGSGF